MDNMIPILGTGLSGLVGSRFVSLLSSKYTFSNLDLSVGVDITNEEQVMRAVEASQSPVIVHMAAFTDVNRAWEERGNKDGLCYKVNVLGTQNIAKAAQKYNKHCIHLSTAFVFDGTSDGMYTEEDIVHPIEWYGETKAEAERVVQEICSSYTLFRIDQPFRSDPFPKQDTVHKMVELLSKPEYTPFVDHFFAPTIIEDFSKALDWAITEKPQGMYHATCNKKISDYEYAKMINQALKLNKTINPGSLEDYLKTTQRPYQKNTALDSSKLMKAASTVVFTPLEDALAQVTLTA